MPEKQSLPPAVVIIGASTGIGRACALEMDRRGFRTFAGIRSDEAAEKLLAAGSSRLTPVRIDVTEKDSISAAAQLVRDAVGDAGLAGLSIMPESSCPAPSSFCLSIRCVTSLKST